MSGGGSQNSIRMTIGALKDTTTVSLAKINSGYKDLDIAVVKATSHYERPAKEKHISAIFVAISASRPRADVAYCIHALARRLSKTRNWVVALKTLIVIHRAMREVDLSFQEQLLNYGRSRNHILNLIHFKDDSSPDARGYSAWVRSYALYLEERLECFRKLKYDIEADHLRTKDLNTPELLEHLPALHQLLYRVIGCQPHGASIHNFIIQLALAMVASESIKIYTAISNGSANLVDKFFEMERNDALKALDIYQRAGLQAERLSEFYEVCKNLDVEREKRYIKIEQPPASLLHDMEEYVMDVSRSSTAHKNQGDDNPKAVLAIEYKKSAEVQEAHPPSSTKPEPKPEYESVKVEVPVLEPQPDLLDLNDPVPTPVELDEKNALALAIIPDGVEEMPVSAGPNLVSGSTTGWELALVTDLSSNKSTAAASNLAGGFDKLTLDSLYDDAIRRSNQNVNYNPWEQTDSTANYMMPEIAQDPFYVSNTVTAPPSIQMALMANQQQAFMLQQHQQMMMMGPRPMNPFGNPYGHVGHSYGQAYNPFS